jgi:heptaprenyl diphosphate synthase
MLGNKRLQKEYQLHVKRKTAPVFQAVQATLSNDDDRNVEAVFTEWLKKMDEQEKSFLQSHKEIDEIVSALKDKLKT